MAVHFTGPYQRQNWSIPDSLIYYITMKPSSSKAVQKLHQSCKYFFSKNPVMVLSCLHFDVDGWKTCANKCEMKPNEMRRLDFENTSAKFWIKDVFYLRHWNFSITPSYILPKIYQCEAKRCELSQQSMTLDEFLFLASSAECCFLNQCTVIDGSGLHLQLEAILANLPQIKQLFCHFIQEASNISSQTVKELLKLPHFSSIKSLCLKNVGELFDIDAFFTYYKSTTNFYCGILFSNSISDVYKQRLETVMEEMIATPSPLSYRPLLLKFLGQDQRNRMRLLMRYF